MTYNEFIQNILDTRGRNGCGEEYYETHHVLPRCLSGTDDKDNLIDLFAKEHYEAHRLLALEHPDNTKLQYAWWMMCHCKNDDRQYEISAEEYEQSRIAFSKSISGKNHPMYGKHISEEHREKLRKSISGENNYNYGKHLSEETRKKLSEAHKGIIQSEETRKKRSEALRGEKHPLYGKHHTDESRKKMSESQKNRPPASEETKEKLRIANSGENNPFYGKHHTEVTKKKLSEALSGENHPMYGKHLSDETKRKLSEARKGIPCSEEAKQKISATLKGKYVGEESPCAKGVVQYDLDGNLIRIWECIAQATRECNIDKTGITACCRGRQKSAGGFKWRYKDEYEKEQEKPNA